MGDLPRGDKMDRLQGKRAICVIVQARMGSTRLPGKVMKDIVGKPLVLHVVERIKRITPKDTVVIATTTLKEDDTIVDAVTDYDTTINIYRGSSQDVLDRYYRAAIHCKADVIVRITADNPLIDPDISGTVIEAFLKNQCDYCCNNMPRTYPHGLDTEVFSFESLERAWKKAHTPYEREHVTPYIREHPGEFTLLNVEHTTDLSNLRWSVDYCEDFAFVTEIYKRLYFKNQTFTMEDVLDILDKEPWLCEMNEVVP
jgi:spore coat polysaccharide biosynthesis protein SpsF (cytidylyltransferase family)